jgi:LPPG:FO 2-phospho-L-lactate transferase
MSNAPRPGTGRVVALCGGVGAARFLRGLVRVVAPEDVIAVVNTGDDREFYGVHVSPDLDIVTYTLAGVVDTAQGYGLAGDTYALMNELEALGHETWFRLGDRDLAQCLHRTLRMRDGVGLAAITQELAERHGLAVSLLPMSEQPCPTRVVLKDGRLLHFEEYMIRERAPDAVERVDLSAAANAKPSPGVLEAIRTARVILFCPSNPVVSIGPILAVEGIRDAVAASAAPKLAVSPIVGGAAIKGPASQLLRGIGVEVSALGVARHYGELIDGFVFDERDHELAKPIADLSLRVRVTDTMMVDANASARLAAQVLELAGECA